MTSEWTRYYHEPEWHDLEVLHARFVGHRFARLVNPGESHTGEAATADGYVYRTMYPRPALMEQVVLDATGRKALPFFRHAVVDDRRLTRLLAAFHREIAECRSRLAADTLLTDALIHLIVQHTDDRFCCAPVGRERTAVRHAREYIDASFAGNVTLSQLSAIAGLSPFHLARAFEKDVGLPPHVYLEMVRTQRARSLLDAGNPIADVAVAVGYADQSHLTHRFKRLLGITPGQYARERKIRQNCSIP